MAWLKDIDLEQLQYAADHGWRPNAEWMKLALDELRALRALAAATTALWEADDSPAPNAQLMYEDAKFDVFKALEAWRAGRMS